VLERTVDAHVMNLRRKIEDDAAEPRYVQTVYGRGYRLADPETETATAPPPKLDSDATQ
jgi:DNA-binding response OmpR family regulator